MFKFKMKSEPKLAHEEIEAENEVKSDTVKKPQCSQLVANIAHTQYSVVKEVLGKAFGFQLSADSSADWDLCWADTGVTQELVSKLKSYQKINHFPNMSCIARKNNLGRNLSKMRKAFRRDYSFFSPTWVLPLQWNELSDEMNRHSKVYIVKPEGASQGKGIYLTNNIDKIEQGKRCVVQRYVRKPYLIDGLKFDLRIYALVYGCDPLRIFLYKEGLARFATEKYVKPSMANINNMYMHLTNYSINRTSKNFISNTNASNPNTGHKRSLAFIWNYIDSHNGNSKSIRRKVKRAIVKTLCAVQPQLSHCFRSCQPFNLDNSMCFEVLGFDVLLDYKLKPWVLEVNHAPSFGTDSPFDRKVKFGLIRDVVRLVNVRPEKRREYERKEQEKKDLRMYVKNTGSKVSREEREEIKKRVMEERDLFDAQNCGGFTRIYPDAKLNSKYQQFIDYAERELEAFYGLRKREPQLSNSKQGTQFTEKTSSIPRPKTGMPKRANSIVKNLEVTHHIKPRQSSKKSLMMRTIDADKENVIKERRPQTAVTLPSFNDIKAIFSKYKESCE
eukprot:TRINITY_DN13580_c0_g1_i15.p1 TRINITY_DN13580_c0_g1~~TRINITY_DN13580_c0_g1_i15.p1  ORF type:complete len:558 (+),score=82.13 TRINITY_DN13580_c0_g1_i15:156-1829(+)